MADTPDREDVTEPVSNAEKFKPKNVQEEGKAGPGLPRNNEPDLQRGSAGETRRASKGAR